MNRPKGSKIVSMVPAVDTTPFAHHIISLFHFMTHSPLESAGPCLLCIDRGDVLGLSIFYIPEGLTN